MSDQQTHHAKPKPGDNAVRTVSSGRSTTRDRPESDNASAASIPRAGRRTPGWLGWGAAAAAGAAAYMAYEAQWVRCREITLPAAGLPPAWSGLRILHLSDVHAGVFPTNDRSLEKVVRWAVPLAPDLVFLTGDVLGDPERSASCLRMLARLQPTLGAYAVTGNHEYGIGKGPLAHQRDTHALWERAGITLLRDQCVALPPRGEPGAASGIVLCGADYLSAGFGLLDAGPTGARGNDPQLADAHPEGPNVHDPGPAAARPEDGFPILLIHEPPAPDSPLARLFPLAFAGHTHGGQLRLPGRRGLTPVSPEQSEYLAGVYAWGDGLLVVSRGVGTSFLPFRLLTRPEATLWRLV